MNFTHLFTSLRGRINRAKWWAGQGMLLLVFSAIAWIGDQTPFGQTISALAWILLYVPAYPLAAKRFQDRGKRGDIALYGYVPAILAAGLLSFGPVVEEARIVKLPLGELDVSLNWNTNPLGDVCFLILIVVTIWFLIELGMRKGTPGPNRFGPDPLGQSDAKMAGAASRS
jgi:uncharacterized membrane protein YhaH (DUF805 family)